MNQPKFQSDLTELNTRLHGLHILDKFEITAQCKGHFTAIKDDSNVKITASETGDSFYLNDWRHRDLHSDWWNVASAMGDGALNELTGHLDRVALSAGIGFVVGLGTAFMAPELATALAIGGIGLAIVQHAQKWYHDAKIVADPEDYSVRELREATDGIRNLGSGATDVAAGFLGGLAGNRVAAAIEYATQPVHYDGQGHPTKLPDHNGKPVYVKYDEDGHVISLERGIGGGWRETVRQTINPEGTGSWTWR